MKMRARHPRGFTLIEALAAIAVLVIVIPVLLQGFNIATDIAGLTRQTSSATLLAQSKLDELVATDGWQGGMAGGSEKIGPDDFTWDYSVDPWSGETNVNLLTVHVEWFHRGTNRSIAISTVVYIPLDNSQTTGTSGLSGGMP